VEDFHANLRRGATLTVIHTQDIQVCLQEAYPLPTDINWWNQSCTRYYKFQSQGGNAEPSTIATRLRDVHYNLAVALWNRDGSGLKDKKDTISLTLGTGEDSCEEGQVYDDNKRSCLDPTNITINTPINHTFAGERAYFSFEVPPRAARIDISSLAGDAAKCVFQLRRNANPSIEEGFFDGKSGAHASFDYPRPGRYYFVARATVDNTVGIFQVSINVCGNNTMVNGTLGPNCNIPYNTKLEPNMKMVAVADQFTYWQVQCTQQKPMTIMVRSFDGAFIPRIYASRDQLPLADTNSDLNNCHGTSCSGVNTLNLTCTSETIEYWYIGVTAAERVNGTSYGIWFTPVCAPGCDLHGECSYSDPNVGECVCDPQYLGPDCSIESDVNARFIVLCVIAALLVVSALVGLIVQKVQLWRKSKASYQQL